MWSVILGLVLFASAIKVTIKIIKKQKKMSLAPNKEPQNTCRHNITAIYSIATLHPPFNLEVEVTKQSRRKDVEILPETLQIPVAWLLWEARTYLAVSGVSPPTDCRRCGFLLRMMTFRAFFVRNHCISARQLIIRG